MSQFLQPPDSVAALYFGTSVNRSQQELSWPDGVARQAKPLWAVRESLCFSDLADPPDFGTGFRNTGISWTPYGRAPFPTKRRCDEEFL